MNPEDIRQLVQARIGQAVESLEDAQTLLEAGRSGRSIVNRSYYSMFYGVLALLQTINRIPRKHQSAISFFDREFVHKGLLTRELSADLHRVFEPANRTIIKNSNRSVLMRRQRLSRRLSASCRQFEST
jgi:uncharacterized protein (UPF0332 family)